jgi:hypothetical protein
MSRVVFLCASGWLCQTVRISGLTSTRAVGGGQLRISPSYVHQPNRAQRTLCHTMLDYLAHHSERGQRGRRHVFLRDFSLSSRLYQNHFIAVLLPWDFVLRLFCSMVVSGRPSHRRSPSSGRLRTRMRRRAARRRLRQSPRVGPSGPPAQTPSRHPRSSGRYL